MEAQTIAEAVEAGDGTSFEKEFMAFKAAKLEARNAQSVCDTLRREIETKMKELEAAKEEHTRKRKRVAALSTKLPELLSREMVGA